MRKSLFITFLVFTYIWSFSIFNAVKADDKTTVVVGHVISETIKGTDIDVSYIMEKEFEAAAHKFLIEATSILQAYLPVILEGVAAELRLKADHEYKCKLLENGGMNDGCN
tara:strand:+ start:243 stop:575 length:333 start_codon:yes stop_codon:yes gene_type:complete